MAPIDDALADLESQEPGEQLVQLSPSRLLPGRALVEVSQASTFESQLRKSRPEDAIVAPTKGSERVTATSSAAAPDNETLQEAPDASLMDDFEGVDWRRLRKYMKPLSSQNSRKSRIYRHGYRDALLKDPKLPKRGHGHSKSAVAAKPTWLQRLLKDGNNRMSQKVANELAGFNTQRFRLAAVSWLVENNHPLSEFETPAFRRLLEAANLLAERALWTSHALSKVHLSFDGWMTKGGKRGFLGVLAHFVDSRGDLQDLPIALPQLTGAHSGERMGEVVIKTLQDFKITSQSIGYFVLNNATNNDSTITILAQEHGFNATHPRLRYGPHTLNLIGQTLLWGKGSAASFDNGVQELTDEHDLIEEWRRVGPLGVLLNIINYIKTPQQHKLFEDFQRLAHTALPFSASADDRKILEPVKPVVTRWNSYYSCFERAVKLQFAVNPYATHHIQRVQKEDTFAQSRGNKLPVAQPWMRSDGLTGADWAVITEYIDILQPLKTATKRLEGRGKRGSFGAIAEIISVFEYLRTYYEQRVNAYEAVNYNEHDESPEDHIAINLRAAWQRADDYYSQLDDSPAYYAATILNPMYKYYCDKAWARKPDWLEASNASFHALWAQYNTSPRAVRPSAVIPSDVDDAIDSILNPITANILTADEDEFKKWKHSEPAAERGTEHADNPIKYWVSMRDSYPSLSKLVLDVLSISASSCECERLFSELGDLQSPQQSIRIATKSPSEPAWETQFLESQPEAEIVALTEGSHAGTISIADDAGARRLTWETDGADHFDGERLKQYIKPVKAPTGKRSWIYQHGYRFVKRSNPKSVWFVCRYCHSHNVFGGGLYDITRATSAAASRRGKFRLAFVLWLVDNNVPMEIIARQSTRDMIKFANPEAESALWRSPRSVATYAMRLFKLLKPQIVLALSTAVSKIHISFDGWTTKGGKRGFFGIVAHFATTADVIHDLPISLTQLAGAHTVAAIPRDYGGFHPAHRRLRCGSQTINLISQALLFGDDKDSYDNQHELFEDCQREANKELPADEQLPALAPVRPVVTRWNSYFAAIERATLLHCGFDRYMEKHVSRVAIKDKRSSKPADAPLWMRSGGLSASDRVTITEYQNCLEPLKIATKSLEGRSDSSSFGAIYEVLPVFDYISRNMEELAQPYANVDFSAQIEAPEGNDYILSIETHSSDGDGDGGSSSSSESYKDNSLAREYDIYNWAELLETRSPSPREALASQATEGSHASTGSIADDADAGAGNAVQYWIAMRSKYPCLSQFAIDILTIPASSCECERLFSELGDLLQPKRRAIGSGSAAYTGMDSGWLHYHKSDRNAQQRWRQQQ
ncbi:transposase-like protein [Stemphylium lycopersici]|nr:transposase-like protein [Stemphylium lycopersici]